MNPRKLIRLLLVTRSFRFAFHAWKNDVPWSHLERRGGRVLLKGTNIAYEDLPERLAPGLSLAIASLAPFKFGLQVADAHGEKRILLDTGQVKLWLDGADVTFVAEEVFGTQEYGIQIVKESIVIDVGMNVATAALFFAQQPVVKRIVGFEPSLSVIARAERNLAINPEIAKKIEIRACALGEVTGEAYLEVIPEQSTTSKIPEEGSEISHANRVLVDVRDAEAELQSVLKETGVHQQIVLKIDCEGMEREIFQRLSTDTLSRIQVILVEWHSSEILSEITERLARLNFQLLVRRKQKEVGMLCAFC